MSKVATSKKTLVERAQELIPDMTAFDVGLIERAYDFGPEIECGNWPGRFLRGHVAVPLTPSLVFTRRIASRAVHMLQNQPRGVFGAASAALTG